MQITKPENLHAGVRRALTLVYAARNDLHDYLARPEDYAAPEFFKDPHLALNEALSLLLYVNAELYKENKE